MQPRFLVITLYSNENEFELCKASVAEQTGVFVNHEVIAGLDNQTAHKTLYQMIMREARKYDYFLKLDADMVLKRTSALDEVHRAFLRNPNTDHLVSMVHDHYTDRMIYGVHCFSPHVVWHLDRHDRMFVDPDPQYEGKLLRDPRCLAVFVDHAPDPSKYQAFHFGFHRTLKLMQMIRTKKSARHIRYQLAILRDIEANYARGGPENLGMAILASDLVRQGRLTAETGDKKNMDVETAFRHLAMLNDGEVRKRIRRGKVARYLAFRWILFRTHRRARRERRHR